MHLIKARQRMALLLAPVFLTLSACAPSQESRLYTLTPILTPATLHSGIQEQHIGIGPVTLPQYLDRPQIVRRLSPYRLDVAEFERWAEPLAATVPRLIANNVAALLAHDHVYTLPRRRRTPIDLTVEVDIQSFEPVRSGQANNGHVNLQASWSIYRDSDMPIGGGVADITVENDRPPQLPSIGADDVEEQVRLLSEALARLSGQIAGSLASL